jgi:hypothetical protein
MEMGTLVEQQEETIDNIESTAKDVEADAGKAYAFSFDALTWQGFLILSPCQCQALGESGYTRSV